MLGNYLSSLLIAKFGSFLDGLDPKNVSINVWNGRISYSNLLIKADYCNNFIKEKLHMPVAFKFGQVGQFEINIPWSVLRAFSKPSITSRGSGSNNPDITPLTAECSIIIRDVNVLLACLDSCSDESKHEISSLTSLCPHEREKKIQEILGDLIQQSECFGLTSSNPSVLQQHQKQRLKRYGEQSSWREAYLNRLLTNIFSTLKIRVENVHIRYQFESILDNKIFSVGLTFDAFNVSSVVDDLPAEDLLNQEQMEVNNCQQGTFGDGISRNDSSQVAAEVNPKTLPTVAFENHVDPQRHYQPHGVWADAGNYESITTIQKEALLQHFSIYWDSNIVKSTDPHWMDNFSTHESSTASEKMSPESQFYQNRFTISSRQHMHDHHYFLNPTSVSLKVSFKDPFHKSFRKTASPDKFSLNIPVKDGAVDINNQFSHPESCVERPIAPVTLRSRTNSITSTSSYHLIEEKSGSSKSLETPSYNKVLFNISLCRICINRGMLSDLTSFRRSFQHYYLAKQKVEQSVKKILDHWDERNRHENLPMQYLEYWHKPRVLKQISFDTNRKKRWLWLRSIVLLNRNRCIGLFSEPSKIPNYKCWYTLTLLLRARQSYGNLYLCLQSAKENGQEGILLSRNTKNEDIADVENSLCLTLEEIACWRLYALTVMATEAQPKEKGFTKWSLYSLQMAADLISKFAQGTASTDANACTSTEEQPNMPQEKGVRKTEETPSLTLEHIVSTVLKEEQHASTSAFPRSDSVLTDEFPQSSGEFDSAAWVIAVELSSLQVQLYDTMALTQMMAQSRKIMHIPIFKFECSSHLDFCSHFSGDFDMNLSLPELEVIDLTSFPSTKREEAHPLLFGLSKRPQLSSFEDARHGGIRLQVQKKKNKVLGESAVISIVALISPLEFHYRTNVLEALSRMFSSATSQSDDVSKARFALQQFTFRQTERIKQALLNDDCDISGDNCSQNDVEKGITKFIFDIELFSPMLKYSDLSRSTAQVHSSAGVEENSIVLSFDRLHVCNTDKNDHIPEEIISKHKPQLTWAAKIAALRICSGSVSVLSPLSLETVFSHIYPPFSPPQLYVAIDLPPVNLCVSKSFRTLLGRLSAEWSGRSRYWANQQLTQQRAEQQKSSVLVLHSLPEDCERGEFFFSPTPSPTRLAKLSSIHNSKAEESLIKRTDMHTGSSVDDNSERQTTLHVTCVAEKISLLLVNDVDYAHIHTSCEPVPIILIILYTMKITLDRCRLQQLRWVCVLDDIIIEDHFLGWYSSFFSSNKTSQLPKTKMMSSLRQGMSSLVATTDGVENSIPTPFLTIEYSASDFRKDESSSVGPPEASFSVSVAKTAFINWSPETIAASQLALKAPCQQVATESLFKRGAVDNGKTVKVVYSSEENDEFFDAREILEESVPLFFDSITQPLEQPVTPCTINSSFGDITLGNLPLKGNSSDKFQYQTGKSASIYLNFDKIFINFLKPPNEFVQQVSKLFCASADSMSVTYSPKENNGMKISFKMNNFVLQDGCSVSSFDSPLLSRSRKKQFSAVGTQHQYCTLYDEILDTRLPNQQVNDHQRLLVICYESFPRNCKCTGRKSVGIEPVEEHKGDSYLIIGQDSLISVQLPRFTKLIYIQQLWMEVIDFFFEGITGSEVLYGKPRDHPPDPTIAAEPAYIPPSKLHAPDNVSFCSMIVDAEDLIVLLPVSHCSPEYLKLTFSFTALNHFDGKISENESYLDFQWLQWFNNLKLSFSSVRIFNWYGQQLSTTSLRTEEENIRFEGIVRWPIGPTAPLIIPKWDVSMRLSSVTNVVNHSQLREELTLSLKQDDYALFQNIISYNICGESRNYQAWLSWKLANKDQREIALIELLRMVKFGYDIKDGFPSTYAFHLTLSSLILDLVQPCATSKASAPIDHAHQSIAATRIKCSSFVFSIEKMADWVSRQEVTLRSVNLMTNLCDAQYRRSCRNVGKMIDLIFPLPMDDADDGSVVDLKPALVYTSMSNPHSDNVKTLTLFSNCIIDLSNPTCWLSVKDFFSNLPPPVIWNEAEVLGSIRIGDRWYSIDHATKVLPKTATTEVPKEQCSKGSSTLMSNVRTIKYQFRMVLCSPHILLGVINEQNGKNKHSNISIRFDLDYLYTLETNCMKIEDADALFMVPNVSHEVIIKKLWIHTNYNFQSEAVLYNSSMPCAPMPSGSSLMDPLNVSLRVKGCIPSFSKCVTFVSISVGFIGLKLHYSDIGIILDAVSHFLENMKASNYKDNSSQDQGALHESITLEVMMNISGLSALTVDDSGRHFTGAQDLLQWRLGEINLTFKRDQHTTGDDRENFAENTISAAFQLQSLHVIDCLQDLDSSFRVALTSTASPDELLNGSSSASLFKESDVAEDVNSDLILFSEAAGGLGFVARIENIFVKEVYPSQKKFIEVMCKERTDISSFDFTVGSLVMQWNPSTVIAVQRFLGRAYKDFLKRFPKKTAKNTCCASQESEKFPNEQVQSNQTNALSDNRTSSLNGRTERHLNAALHLETFSIILNKEHQERHLLNICISDLAIRYITDSREQSEIFGSMADLYAVDLQHYSPPPGLFVAAKNLTILSVNRPIENINLSSKHVHGTTADSQMYDSMTRRDFVDFHFRKCQASDELSSIADGNLPLADADLPLWVLQSAGPVDDFLSATMSSLLFVYLSERTAELVDYLSNGLPGKGMGRTAAAAKGFFGARIKTRSAMSIVVEAPVIRIPRHLFTDSFVQIRLGDVRIKSWFEERTFTSALMTSAKDIQGFMAPSSPGQNDFLLPSKCREMATSEEKPTMSNKLAHDSEPNDWWRCLSITIVNMGFSTSCYLGGMNKTVSRECPPCLQVILRKPLWYHSTLVIRSNLSFIKARLSYSDWALIWLAYEDNVGRKADSSKWDTVHDDSKYFWGEHEADELEQLHPKNFTYSDNARFIRYGIKKDLASKHLKATDDEDIKTIDAEALKPDTETTPMLDLKLELEGLHITLHRDDTLPNIPMTPPMLCCYDSTRVRVKHVEAEFIMTAKGDQQLILSLFKLDWIDLGNVERLRRQAALGVMDSTAVPCAFTVIAEGSTPKKYYSVSNASDDLQSFSSDYDRREFASPQLAVSVYKPADGIPVASIVLNYLTINALVKPIVETLEFLSCSWPTAEASRRVISSHLEGETIVESYEKAKNLSVGTKTNPKEVATVEGFSLKLVAHYPQVFLLADEGDPFSRALVFRGLAVIDFITLKENVASSFLIGTSNSLLNFPRVAPELKDVKWTQTLSAELHSMESYINPDVSEVLTCKQSSQHGKNPPQLGIALIEPVTASLCLSESSRELFPTNRVANFHVDALSTILSFGDVDLIDNVLRRWLEERGRSSKEYHTSQGCKNEHNIVLGPPSLDHSKLHAVEPLKSFHASSWENECIAAKLDMGGSVSEREAENLGSFHTYTVVFNTDKLGLVLRKEKAAVVVEKVHLSDTTSCINAGDILFAVADVPLCPKTPFKMVARNLEIAPRPIKLTFLRSDEGFVSKVVAEDASETAIRNNRVFTLSHQISSSSIAPSQEKATLDQQESCSLSPADLPKVASSARKAATSEITSQVNLRVEAPPPLSKAYTIEFLVGESNGLRFDQALKGSAAIVSGIDQALYATATSCSQHHSFYEDDAWGWMYNSDAVMKPCTDVVVHGKRSFTSSVRISDVEATLISSNYFRLPRPGAVLLAINGFETAGQDFQAAMERLRGAMAATDENQPLTYTLTFIEIPASEWSTVDQITLDVKGVSLTVIDDINGRDMPLIRSTMENLQFCFDQGFGLATQMIAVCPPSILKLDSSRLSTGTSPSHNSSYGKSASFAKCSDASEVIMKACIESVVGIEYYNPRLAIWEPLLEPCLLRFVMERQAGNAATDPPRPGHLSILMSDGENSVTGRKVSKNGGISGTVAVNLTDAAAEVLFTAVSDWHRRRVSLISSDSFSNEDVNEAERKAKGRISKAISSTMSDDKVPKKLFMSEGVSLGTSISSRRKATHEVAMVAAKVAKKHEDEASGGVAKPFILRNRTGVSIEFHLQNSIEAKRVVENNCEVRFNIDLFATSKTQSGSISSSLVRSYGQAQPFLCILLNPMIGVSDPLTDLPVMKVGQYFRRLRVRNEADGEEVPLLLSWTVDISNNRRVLTLSGSVRVDSLISGVPIEIGVKAFKANPKIEKETEFLPTRNDEVFSVGVARPGSPCFLPIWLCEQDFVTVHIRPVSRTLQSKNAEETSYAWSTNSLLEYAKICVKGAADEVGAHQLKVTGWRWQRSGTSQPQEIKAKTALCEPKGFERLPAFLHYSVDAFEPCASANFPLSDDNKATAFVEEGIEAASMLIEVSIASTLTIRNLLPVAMEWEVIKNDSSLKETQRTILLDGSGLRARQHRYGNELAFGQADASLILESHRNEGLVNELKELEQYLLESGQAIDVLSCESQAMSPMARFRCQGCDGKWSDWAELSLFNSNVAMDQNKDRILDEQLMADGHGDISSFSRRRRGIQTTFQCQDGSGTPLCFGLRIQSRSPVLHRSGCKDGSNLGLEVTVFAEIWIKNLTSLPLVFGAPSSQVKSSGVFGQRKSKTGSSGKLMAEAAVLEIASVLDFGEFGRDLNLDDNLRASGGDILILPRQQGKVVVEEVFEYIEVESSCVRRRWWASEKHDESRQRPIFIGLPDQTEWRWDSVADSALHGWRIDSSGGVIVGGGWESCKSLVGGSSFNAKRFFDSSHPYRRRRLFRRRFRLSTDADKRDSVMFYQPFRPTNADSDARKAFDKRLRFLGTTREDLDVLLRLAVKCGDGQWSAPIFIPPRGISNGLVRVISARWPQLCGKEGEKSNRANSLPETAIYKEQGIVQSDGGLIYEAACLNPSLYDLCYQVSILPGTWGEFSRILTISPRYLIRNDSEIFSMDVKQAGASDDTSVRVGIGEVIPFYWSDFRLPELVCIRPVVGNGKRLSVHTGFCDAWEFTDYFKWSGGIDMCDLRMSAIRIRKNPSPSNPFPSPEDGALTTSDAGVNDAKRHALCLRTVRARVEIRSGTGGVGITFSVKDEDYRGEGSLFRIENLTPFPIWVAQDGILSNPGGADGDLGIIGDLISPKDRLAFGLDAPFRQGKHGRVVPYHELYLTRVTLAPLNLRDGVECTKVIGLTSLGSSIRLSPSKLRNTLDEDAITQLLGIRLLGVVCSDGPTRVLRFCVIQKEVSAGNVFGDAMRRQFFDTTRIAVHDRKEEGEIRKLIQQSAAETVALMRSGRFPSASEVENRIFLDNFTAKYPDPDTVQESHTLVDSYGKLTAFFEPDLVFSFEASLNGFLVSLVDSEPSEISVILVNSLEVFAKWNKFRTKDAVVGVNVGWLQVDNHCPGAPYPVAVCPDGKIKDQIDDVLNEDKMDRPFLSVKMAFAPKHSSGIACLRSATISPMDLNISVDLAFVARLQRFFLELQEHFERALTSINSASVGDTSDFWPYSDVEEKWPFPKLLELFKTLDGVSMASAGAGEIYFEGLFIEPCHLNLSIAPARALSAAEAAKEGADAAAIHAAVRKGDLDLAGGGGEAFLGVKVGSRNRTAIQVVRGIFKNIFFDALLRCESAMMDFPGVFLQNHITSGPQLSTYMIAHYVTALRNNLPALLGSLAAFGNPVGLIRDLGDGVSDFVSEPIKGFRKSLQELDPTYVVDGVAKGTGSLARHAVGGFADSASMLTETLSKNMAVLTLDRRYAQQRDRSLEGRSEGGFVEGIGSGSIKIVKGVVDGVTGVVRQPIKGAERSGVEGFTKGLGKGLIGLVVKPVIGLSDAATDVMIGVKGSIEKGAEEIEKTIQVRPRRVLYGEEKAIRVYNVTDARAAFLVSKIKEAAADQFLSHIALGELTAILTTKRLVVLTENGTVKNVIKYTRIKDVEVGNESIELLAQKAFVHVVLNSSTRTKVTISCPSQSTALELCRLIMEGMNLDTMRRRLQQNFGR